MASVLAKAAGAIFHFTRKETQIEYSNQKDAVPSAGSAAGNGLAHVGYGGNKRRRQHRY